MAKQTFTTGQVLTAAQMTSLQQTAMLGGSTTVKTASYVLVAADAGTTVAMSAAGATTITVNTSLFAAGDIVFIQNRGAGACTVTAGTATVVTAGSLILPTNDAGILYFTATGASIFYDFIQAGAVSPLTTKGDIYTFSTSDARLAVGTNGQVLTADSAEATGLKFATASAGALTKITSDSFSAQTSVSVNAVFDSTYTTYMAIIESDGSVGGADFQLQYTYAGPTTQTTGYYGAGQKYTYANALSGYGFQNATQSTIDDNLNSASFATYTIYFKNVGNGSDYASNYGTGMSDDAKSTLLFTNWQVTARNYTGFLLKASSGNITGNYAVYGLAN